MILRVNISRLDKVLTNTSVPKTILSQFRFTFGLIYRVSVLDVDPDDEESVLETDSAAREADPRNLFPSDYVLDPVDASLFGPNGFPEPSSRFMNTL